MNQNQYDYQKVRIWLLFVYFTILLMVVVGGITRLTGSGLSIVDWRPITGAIPPLNEMDWMSEFDKYKASPQFKEVNFMMSLGEFKQIYFWEYIHRLLGRLIGVIFFVPLIYFWFKKQLTGPLLVRGLIAMVLGGLQGALGWFMVKSGLVKDPAVSHFRLAAHLSLAFFVGQYLLWFYLDLKHLDLTKKPINQRHTDQIIKPFSFLNATLAYLALLCTQIVYGAFMAGKKAGSLYNTFPLMAGSILPESVTQTSESLTHFLFENPHSIHWIHRSLAWFVLIFGILLFTRLRRACQQDESLRQSSLIFLIALVMQFVLGALTVLFNVPISVATIHQGMAYLLLSSVVVLIHALRKSE